LLAAALERFPQGKWRDEALLLACRHGRATWVSRLLAAGADPNAAVERRIPGLSTPCRESPLDWAANPWHHGEAAEITRLLLDAGAHVDGIEGGTVPLLTAILRDQPRVFELLIARGADVRRVDKNGQTPLHHAASSRSGVDGECTKLLIAAGVPLDAVDAYGRTALSAGQISSWGPSRRR
jgi:hypothetical protein